MKTPAKKSEITSIPKKNGPQKPETDYDSTTNDPTQPDTETSHKKVHKIGESVKHDKNK
jgi:hypothetical protein